MDMVRSGDGVFDLTVPDHFADGHPFETYDRLRATEPVYRNPGAPQGAPLWVLTRHADIDAVSRDNVNYSSIQGNRVLEQGGGLGVLKPHIRAAVGSMMLTMDPPQHGAVRRPMQGHFMPSALRRLEQQVDAFVEEMVTELPAGEDIEFVTRVAAIVPIRTLCLMLGIPEEDRPKVFDWTNRLVGTSDPEYGATPEESNAVFEEVFDYGSSLLEQRRAEPREDLLTAVSQLFADGTERARTIEHGMFTLLLAAGNETTRNSLSGAIAVLSRFPEQRRLLAENPDLIESAIPELLRFVTPVYQMMRTAVNDVIVGGQTVAAGERVALLYGAANRDPAMFTDPHRLDIGRANAARHLSFGIGIHHCLGARVATMQLAALLRAILKRFPDIEIASEPDYLRSNFVCGIKRLSVHTGTERRQ